MAPGLRNAQCSRGDVRKRGYRVRGRFRSTLNIDADYVEPSGQAERGEKTEKVELGASARPSEGDEHRLECGHADECCSELDCAVRERYVVHPQSERAVRQSLRR